MKIAIAMSGGVDSSVAAAILSHQSQNDTFGIFMKNWSDNHAEKTGECTWVKDRLDALAVAAQLGLVLKTVDFEEQYRTLVLDYFYQEYQAGRTPNPDILCNKLIKFDALLKYAEELGADKIATGHYARVREGTDGYFHLLKGKDANKDQSYFLCQLNQSQLAKTLFPVGEMEKKDVRKYATEHNLYTAAKKDSQGVCFIGKMDLQEFLRFRLPPKEGFILNETGERIGVHNGAYNYTIGQRYGLNIHNTSAHSEPWFVAQTDVGTNTVVAVQGHDHPALYGQKLQASNLHWIRKVPTLPYQCFAKIRYRQPDQVCTISETGLVTFEQPQRAITPGQSIVFYQGDECIGSGTIEMRINQI
jgi:tRNA-specific 2-thiouridylase